MSASLVGSEMCIRDRAPPGPARRAKLTGWAMSSCPRSGSNGPSGRTPVSYTHLTLPTICSV
eukprot:13825796-Alexandrium_andersonii.AAC.1